MRLNASCFASLLLAMWAVLVIDTAQAEDATPPDNCSSPTVVRFASGSDAASFPDLVTREGARCYLVAARRGQQFEAVMSADSSANAALMVFRPGWRYRAVHGYRMMDGTSLPGAGRDDGAHALQVRLPETGTYLIEVNTARGDAASYKLRIRVR